AKVAWKDICRPKSQGGLGLKDLDGILQTFITHKDLYNVRRNDSMVMKDIVDQSVCLWPEEWIAKYHVLALYNRVMLNDDKEDSIVWRSKSGKDMKFSIKQAYQDLSSTNEGVKWYKMVWFSKNILKHSLILWMAVQNRLVTQDKYAAEFWDKVKLKAGIQIANMEWNDIVKKVSGMYCGTEMDNSLYLGVLLV
ncbi:reverse transcriptase zinc-binding domain-containing protein, partial [Tanacetum coccineum]